MTASDTTMAALRAPIPPDWTIRSFLEWIAEDDTRCHDDAIRPLLETALTAAGASPGFLPAATVALVRALTAVVREQAQLNAVPLSPSVVTGARVRDLPAAA